MPALVITILGLIMIGANYLMLYFALHWAWPALLAGAIGLTVFEVLTGSTVFLIDFDFDFD